MPGNEPEADDLDRALADQAAEGAVTHSDVAPADPAVLDALKPDGHAEGKTPQKPPQDWEKRYNAIRPEFDKTRGKLKTLEAIARDPRIAELARTDPKIAEALAKAGIQLARDEAAAEGNDGRDEDDDYWKSTDGRMEIMEAANDLRWQIRDFAQESLGRRFTKAEESEVRQMIQKAGALSVEQAWSLTPSGRAERLKAERKRIEEAGARTPQGGRPRPTPSGMGGDERIDMKKPVTQFNDAEKREFLRNLPT